MTAKRYASALIAAGLIGSVATAAWAQNVQITDSDIDSYDPEPTNTKNVVFWSFDTNVPGITTATETPDPQADVFLYNGTTGAFTNLTPNTTSGNEDSTVSADGSTVAWDFWFNGAASPPFQSANQRSIAVYNVAAGTYSVADANIGGGTADFRHPSLSADGSVLAFQSGGDLPGNIYLKSGAGDPVAITTSGLASRPAVSGNGAWVTYADGGLIWAKPVAGGAAVQISASGTEAQTPDINSDGTVIVYELIEARDAVSNSITVSQVVRATGGVLTPLTAGNAPTDHPSVSGDGTIVVFNSKASNLGVDNVDAGNDVYKWVSGSGLSLIVSGSSNNNDDADSYHANISANGKLIGFRSVADNFGTNTVQSARDIYVTVGPSGTASDLPIAPTGTTTTTTTTTPGTTPRGTVAQATTVDDILRATDYRATMPAGQTSDADILRLYQALLDREPDAGGAKYWIAEARRGVKHTDLIGAISVSQEYRNNYGPTRTNTQFLNTLYSNVLDRGGVNPREGDPVGYDYWLGQMNNGLTRELTVFYIAESAEFKGKYPFAAK